MVKVKERAAQAENRARLIIFVATDPQALNLLHRGAKIEFIARVSQLAAANSIPFKLAGESGFRAFLSWCGQKGDNVPPALTRAISERHASDGRHRARKRDFIDNLGLDWSKEDREAHLKHIPTIIVEALPEAYPPVGECISESDDIFKKWHPHFLHWQPDIRNPLQTIHKLQESRLTYDILPEESAIIRNEEDELVGLVFRDLCPDNAAVAWTDDVARDTITDRKNIRLEDPGKLVQIGYSAGARKAAQFHWVRNVLPKTQDSATVAESDQRASSAFAFAWQLMRGRLPSEIIDSFDDFMRATQLKRMDANGLLSEVQQQGRGERDQGPHSADEKYGRYMINAGGGQFEFHHVELAPPAGVFGVNYSRAIHREKQPHKFAVSWTLSRTAGPDWGGHFYFAKYGIRVQAAPNTLIAWIPEEPHGTSLHNVHPGDADPVFCQRGMAFVTSNRLPGVWRKYQAGLMMHAEAEEAIDCEETE